MKRALLLLAALAPALLCQAQQRSPEEATEVARKFFSQRTATRSASEGLQLVATSADLLGADAATRSANTAASFYVFNNGTTGYAVVSGDDRMKPILAYSDHDAFATEGLPENIVYWLSLYDAAYQELQVGSSEKKEMRLTTKAELPATVEPFLKTKDGEEILWDQSTPYNNHCPSFGGVSGMTGCVATAMGMIMKYYEYPEKGIGTHSYSLSMGLNGTFTISFDYEANPFDWANMLPTYQEGAYNQAQADAVANLMFATGVSVDMVYGSYSSSASSVSPTSAFIDIFGYNENTALVMRNYYTSDEWMQMLKTELAAKRPVLYGGSSASVGHQFVFDGYDANDMVHVNWGWSGMNNGYYEVESLNPESTGIGGGEGGGYVMGQTMLIGLQPTSEGTTYTSHFVVQKSITVNNMDWTVGGYGYQGPLQLQKGQDFTIGLNSLGNVSGRFEGGEIGVIAEKDGERILLSSNYLDPMTAGQAYASYKLLAYLTPELQDGTYAVYAATKGDREQDWSRIRSATGHTSKLTLTVEGNNCTVTPSEEYFVQYTTIGALPVTPISEKFYSGLPAQFKMTFANQGDVEFRGQVFALIYQDGNIIGGVGTNMVQLAPGEVQEIIAEGDLVMNFNSSSYAPIPAGSYEVLPGLTWGDYTLTLGEPGKGTPIEIQPLADIQLDEVGVERETLAANETQKVFANFSLSGGDYYTGSLAFAIGPETASSLPMTGGIVEFNEPTPHLELNVPMSELVPQYGLGRYVVLVCQYTNGQWMQMSDKVAYFEVTEASGIDEGQGTAKLEVLEQPATDILRFNAPAGATACSVFDSYGRQVLSQPIDAGAETHTLTVAHLPAGLYILVLNTDDGRTHTAKFLKR